MVRNLPVLSGLLLSLCGGCVTPWVEAPKKRGALSAADPQERTSVIGPNSVAEVCVPPMSCTGHVVVLPNGELIEAAAGPAAAVDAVATAAQAAAKAAEKRKCTSLGAVEGPGQWKQYRKP